MARDHGFAGACGQLGEASFPKAFAGVIDENES
jgi:hypothetical protein